MVIEINNFLSYEECDNLISLASDTFDEVGVLANKGMDIAGDVAEKASETVANSIYNLLVN